MVSSITNRKSTRLLNSPGPIGTTLTAEYATLGPHGNPFLKKPQRSSPSVPQIVYVFIHLSDETSTKKLWRKEGVPFSAIFEIGIVKGFRYIAGSVSITSPSRTVGPGEWNGIFYTKTKLSDQHVPRKSSEHLFRKRSIALSTRTFGDMYLRLHNRSTIIVGPWIGTLQTA